MCTRSGRRSCYCRLHLLLPGFLVGLLSCWHREILKTFLAQPSVFLLPVFTHFTFVTNSKFCCGEGGGQQGERFISFSPRSTAVNVGANVAGILTYIFTLPLSSEFHGCSIISYYLVFGGLPCSILGLILTLVAAFSNQCNCCKSSCCCSCCSEPFEFGALLASSPHTPYILGPDGQLVREEENKEEEVVELEMEESKDSGDPIPFSPSTTDMVVSEKEVEFEADNYQ